MKKSIFWVVAVTAFSFSFYNDVQAENPPSPHVNFVARQPIEPKLPLITEIRKFEVSRMGEQGWGDWHVLSEEDGAAIMDSIKELKNWSSEMAKIHPSELVDPPGMAYSIRLTLNGGKIMNLSLCAGNQCIWVDKDLFILPEPNGNESERIINKNISASVS